LLLEGAGPVYLIGHSLGGMLSVAMAADPRADRLAAIDVSGVPLRYPPEMQPILDRAISADPKEAVRAVPDASDETRRWMFYGADGSFDPAIAAQMKGRNPVPWAEMADAFAAPAVLPSMMARIAVPVQWTIAEEERSSVGGQAMLDEIRSLLTSCPRLLGIVADRQRPQYQPSPCRSRLSPARICFLRRESRCRTRVIDLLPSTEPGSALHGERRRGFSHNGAFPGLAVRRLTITF
jgi:hypothetical protein